MASLLHSQNGWKSTLGCLGQLIFFWASNFSFSLDGWARDQAGCLPTKSLKTYPGQAKFEDVLPKGQPGIQVFFKP